MVIVTYTALAIVGALHAPRAVLLLAVPAAGLIAGTVIEAALVMSGHGRFSAGRLLLAGSAAGGAIPFGAAILALGGAGALALLGMTAGCALLLITREGSDDARIEADQIATQMHHSTVSTVDEESLRPLLAAATGETLLAQWRASGRELATSGPVRRAAVAHYRSLLVEGLERRDPDGVHRWLVHGTVNDPNRYVRIRGSGI